MGRIRRHGYTIEWYIGDHAPRHVHVYDAKGCFLGRFALGEMTGMKSWKPSRDLIKLIRELQKEGRL
jgi:hypothetical protein